MPTTTLLPNCARLLLAAALALASCGDDPLVGINPGDAHDGLALDRDAAGDAEAGDASDTQGGPEDSGAADSDALDAADASAAAEVDSGGPPVVTDPFTEGLREPFTPPAPPAPPEALACAALVNPGAESGDLAGWQVTQGGFVAQQPAGVFGGSYPAAHEGEWYFRAGDSAVSRMRQSVDVSAWVDATAPRYARLEAQVRNRRGHDEAWLALTALDASGNALASRTNGPYLDDDWRLGAVALGLPAETASLRLELRGVRNRGTPNDAYFDAVRLCVYDAPPRPEVAELLAPPYVMNVAPDALTVMFETRAPATGRVRYGDAPDALDHEVVEASAVTTHQLRLTGLAPGSRVYYRVGWGDVELPPYDVLTAPAADDPGRVELVVVADNQDGVETFTRLVPQMAALDPDLVLHGGDAVQNGQRWEYRDYFFGPLFGLGNHAGMFMANGNHETYSSAIFVSEASRRLWEEVVDQPGDEHCFGVRWGPLFVLVLDSERDHGAGSAQYACAEGWLASEDAQGARFRTVLIHRPALVAWWDSVAGLPSEFTYFTAGMDAPDVREHLAPLFEAHGVHLVFSGHNHLYQFVPAWPATVAWVTTGGGGGALESGVASSRVNDWGDYVEEQIFGRYHFLHVIVDGDVLGVRAIALGGEILHTFYLAP